MKAPASPWSQQSILTRPPSPSFSLTLSHTLFTMLNNVLLQSPETVTCQCPLFMRCSGCIGAPACQMEGAVPAKGALVDDERAITSSAGCCRPVGIPALPLHYHILYVRICTPMQAWCRALELGRCPAGQEAESLVSEVDKVLLRLRMHAKCAAQRAVKAMH